MLSNVSKTIVVLELPVGVRLDALGGRLFRGRLFRGRLFCGRALGRGGRLRRRRLVGTGGGSRRSEDEAEDAEHQENEDEGLLHGGTADSGGGIPRIAGAGLTPIGAGVRRRAG